MATYTYSGDPSTSDKDAIRFQLHDTSDPWLFSDEEIEYTFGEFGNVWGAAADLAMIQSRTYTNKRDKTVGPLSIRYGEVADRWLSLAKQLRIRSARNSGAKAIMTQVSTSPHITLGIHDNRKYVAFNDPRALLGDEPTG